MLIRINGSIYTGRELLRSSDTYGWASVGFLLAVPMALAANAPSLALVALGGVAAAMVIALMLKRP